MNERIEQEWELLRQYYSALEISSDKCWGMIRDYQLPTGMDWNKNAIGLCFQFPPGYPGATPYGIYAPSDILFKEKKPDNFEPNAQNKPPFEGEWGLFSWSPEGWNPGADILKGSNMLNFVLTFSERFKQGK